jgi:hypothetical protein
VISTVVLCPHPPLLFRELGGLQDPVADLRRAAVEAVTRATADASRVVAVGGADQAGEWDPGVPVDVRRFGTTAEPPARPGLPASLGVGVRLLREAGWTGPVELLAERWHADGPTVGALAHRLAERPDGTVLLLLGDAGARRGDGAPGYLDPRAFPFDDEVARALRDGDAAALRDLDAGLAEELLVLGSTSLRVLGALAVRQGSAPRATLSYRDDPFGVSYLVATWSFSDAR